MEVMGPERILPNSEEELARDRPSDAGAVPEAWSAEDMEEDEAGAPDEEEDDDNGGYYYQPLNQDPDGMVSVPTEPPEEAGSHAEQIQDVQERIQAMGLHLPQPPAPDSDDEDDPEGTAANRSRASIPMDAEHVELVKRTMAAVNLPSLGVPSWAQDISDDQWSDLVQHTLQTRQSHD
ncbi:male-enhanced antigen 1 [Sardina pilchardus]|uniref:male-enhanced antigen 1 n=1 Tax=Sardina pilchardus TaxID=27697 RepID=UPI002E10B806